MINELSLLSDPFKISCTWAVSIAQWCHSLSMMTFFCIVSPATDLRKQSLCMV